MIEVRYERGVYLPQQDLWLDPWDAKPFAFISYAHSDHIAPHEEIIVDYRFAANSTFAEKPAARSSD